MMSSSQIQRENQQAGKGTSIERLIKRGWSNLRKCMKWKGTV